MAISVFKKRIIIFLLILTSLFTFCMDLYPVAKAAGYSIEDTWMDSKNLGGCRVYIEY